MGSALSQKSALAAPFCTLFLPTSIVCSSLFLYITSGVFRVMLTPTLSLPLPKFSLTSCKVHLDHAESNAHGFLVACQLAGWEVCFLSLHPCFVILFCFVFFCWICVLIYFVFWLYLFSLFSKLTFLSQITSQN